MSKGLGIIERAILSELPQDGQSEQVTYLAWRVARKLGKGIWTLKGHMTELREKRDRGEMSPEEYGFLASFVPRLYSRHPEKLTKSFCAGFSRALKRLEQKGLIERFQETVVRREGDQLLYVLVKVEGSRPRSTRTIRVRRIPQAPEIYLG